LSYRGMKKSSISRLMKTGNYVN